MQVEQKIRAWLIQFPGLVRSNSPQHVLMEALALFKSQTVTDCELTVFTDCLWRVGFKPEQVGSHWQLALPVKPLADDRQFRRLRNIVG